MVEARGVSGVTSSRRLLLARVLGWALAALAFGPSFGIIDLMALLGLDNPDDTWDVPLGASWGTLFTVILVGSYVWIALRPQRAAPALAQLSIVAFSLAVSSLAGLDGRPLWLAGPVALSVGLFAWLAPDESVRNVRGWSLHWPYVVLAVAGLAIWLPYAILALQRSREQASGDITLGIDHWPVQGAVGLTIVLSAVGLGVWTPGRPLLRVTVSLSATLIGAGMLLDPDLIRELGTPVWGVAMVIWGTAIALPRRLVSRPHERVVQPGPG